MILLIDNYDSFTYNLVHRLGELDESLEIVVKRNDEISVAEIGSLKPTHLIISPGPCTPNEAGVSVEAVTALSDSMPILGVCLGHQSVGAANEASIVRATHLYHGKTDQIRHDGRGIFRGLPNPMTATRYHSLVVDPTTLPKEFRMTAWSENGDGSLEIMAIEHESKPLFGLQFHPESFLTEAGPLLLRNFLEVAA